MAKFLLLHLSPIPGEELISNATQTEMHQAMADWMAWFQKIGSAMADRGSPVGKGVNVSTTGAVGPQTQVAGYSVVEAADLDEALRILEDHPHLKRTGASLEVLEMLQMPGM